MLKNKDYITVLGIDPGSTKVGYGVVYHKKKTTLSQALSYGYIDLTGKKSSSDRLLHLHQDIQELIKKFKPSVLAIENVYFFKNLKTFSPVMESKGVIILTASKLNVPVYEYTPLQVKQTIAGYGRADKNYIQMVVKSALGIEKNIKPDDASDALAIGLCYIRHSFL